VLKFELQKKEKAFLLNLSSIREDEQEVGALRTPWNIQHAEAISKKKTECI